MRLYCIAFAGSAHWYGTQADANAGKREKGVGWVEIDVPTDKPGLLAWLNERDCGSPAAEAVIAPPIDRSDPTPPPAAQRSVAHDIAVEEEIERADLPRTIRLADAALFRLNEHVRAAERATQRKEAE